MRNHRINPQSNISRLVAACLILSACLIFGSAWSAKGGGSPPFPISGSFTVSGFCSFDVQVTIIGKGGFISLPDGGFIDHAAASSLTLTNLSDPSKTVMLNGGGTVNFPPVQNGEGIGQLQGRHIFADPSFGFRLLIGEWTYVYDANTGAIIQTPTGSGQNIDLCGLLD